MPRFVKNTLTTISLTIALAAITGHRAQSADTDLRPAIAGMRDEIRELRRDVKALRELLERREDRAADTLPDLPGVHIESYLESNIALRAQASVSKMTGSEIIASIDGRSVFASEIFQRLFTKALTPEGTTLLTATQSLASGQISEQDFRELQVFAIRKFAKDYIRTRVLSQATMASLGKTQKEKTEDAIAKEFDNYLEKVKKDFNVTSIFEVNKRLRKQGTSLLSLKDEFRDRLLADQYLREHATRVEEPLSKHPKSQVHKKREGNGSAITKESPISPKADDTADQGRVVYFFFAKWCGPCQMMMPIIDRMRDEGFRIAKVDVDAGPELVKRFNIMVIPALVARAGDESVNLHGIQSEETLREKLKLFKNLGTPPKDILSQAVPRSDAVALDRGVADTSLRGAAKRANETPSKKSASVNPVPIVGHPDDRPTFAYFFYSQKNTPCQQMMPIIDRLQAEGHRITKVDVESPMTWDQQRFHVAMVPTIWISGGDQSLPLSGIQTEDKIRQAMNFGDWRPAEPARRPPKSEAAFSVLDRRVTVDCDQRPLSEVLEKIFGDWSKIEFRYEQPFTNYRSSDKSVSGWNAEKSDYHVTHETANAYATCRREVTLHIADVSVSVALQRVFDQLHLRYAFENGMLRIEIPADPKLREALLRKVSFDCDKISFQEFLLRASQDWHLKVAMPSTLTSRPHITLHVSGATIESVLKMGFEQAGVRCKFVEDVLVLSPAEPQVILTYPVADLLATPPPSLPPHKVDFQQLEGLIQAATAKSWKGSGGPGQIEHVDNTLSLVIRQSPEVHQQIANLLQKLREPRQLRVTFRAAVLGHRVQELLEGSSVKLPSDSGADFSCLTKAQSDFLLKTSDGALVLERLPAATVAVGKEVTIPTGQGQKFWPQAVRLRTGQMAGRPYLWLDFLGDNPALATPLQTTVQMRLLPDLRPVLIEIKSPPPAQDWQSPWGLTRTVDQVIGKPQERKYLLISSEIEVGETQRESQGTRQ